MFNFGQSFGVLKGVCSAMQLPMYFVRPAKWKKYFNLINSEKDASRTRAIEIFPYFSSELLIKNESNKAFAILISSFSLSPSSIEVSVLPNLSPTTFNTSPSPSVDE